MKSFRLHCSFQTLLFAVVLLVLGACDGSQMFLPKPRGYARVILPPQTYGNSPEGLPYAFKMSSNAEFVPDTTKLSEPYWANINYPTLGAAIQLSYKPIEGDTARLIEYLQDTYTLSKEHQVKAFSIVENPVKTQFSGQAMTVTIDGEVPTPYQFYITDSVNHFFRAALYFKTATKNDSLRPVIDFIKKDMNTMVDTFKWKKIDQKKYKNILNQFRVKAQPRT